jgi:outer membrane protein assembly factor BamB
LQGQGTASPIVWDEWVFVLSAVDTGQTAPAADLPKADPRYPKRTQAPTTYHEFIVYGIDRSTGKIRWQQVATRQVPHEGHHATTNYAAASPITDGRFVYASFGSRGIYCYDFQGRLQWQRDLGRMHTLGRGEGSSPALYGNTIVVNCDHEGDSFITALETRSGQTRWQVKRQEASSWATPLLVEYEGKVQVITSASNRVRSYDLATGQLLWQCAGQTGAVIPSPVAAEGFVYCMSNMNGSRGGFACALPLDATGEMTGGSLLWRHERGIPHVASPLLLKNRLYFTQGADALLTALDIKTGRPITDRMRLPGRVSIYASPVGAAGRIYIVGRDGVTVVLRQSDNEVLATNPLGDPIDASPAIAGKQLLLRSDRYLYCLEEK